MFDAVIEVNGAMLLCLVSIVVGRFRIAGLILGFVVASGKIAVHEWSFGDRLTGNPLKGGRKVSIESELIYDTLRNRVSIESMLIFETG